MGHFFEGHRRLVFMTLNSVLVILRFCCTTGWWHLRKRFYSEEGKQAGEWECFSRKLWTVCSFASLPLSLWLWKYLITWAKVLREEAGCEGFPCILFTKIWYAVHSVKNKLDGIVHWEKVSYLKFIYKLSKRIILKHLHCLQLEWVKLFSPFCSLNWVFLFFF